MLGEHEKQHLVQPWRGVIFGGGQGRLPGGEILEVSLVGHIGDRPTLAEKRG